MSDDNPVNHLNQSLLTQQEALASGQLGDPASREIKDRLAQVEAHIALRRRTGEMEPEPSYDTAWAAEQRLKTDFPFGDPAKPMHEMTAKHINGQFEALSNLGVQRQARLAQDTAEDIVAHPSLIANRPYDPERGGQPSGAEVVQQLVASARPAIYYHSKGDTQAAAELLKLLPLDRQLLERFAHQGRLMTRYAEQRKALGLK